MNKYSINELEPSMFSITSEPENVLIKIDPYGKIFWNGREVETDDEFRAAMLDMAANLNHMNINLRK